MVFNVNMTRKRSPTKALPYFSNGVDESDVIILIIPHSKGSQ